MQPAKRSHVAIIFWPTKVACASDGLTCTQCVCGSRRLRNKSLIFPKLVPQAVGPPVGAGAGGHAAPELSGAILYTTILVRLSQCHRGVLFSHSQYKLGGKALHTIRKTRRCHTPAWRRAQNAVCPNGVGHDGDGPNVASSDASNHNLRTLILACGGLLGWWRRRRQSA